MESAVLGVHLAFRGGDGMKCPKCGSTRTEEHGKNAGDYNWILCRKCGHNWPTEKQAEIDRQRAAKA